ncbi:probable G-protein coupled receptor Mth-like 1 [Cloeon dipterum]|uniref:probable G-protein coupled receptor Mth-like 1 n=1 Tax=Cloeon dipterum TaxID=197152 RepID=UPI00321F80C1
METNIRVFFACLILLLAPSLVSSRVLRLCDKNLRTKVTDGTVQRDGSLLTINGTVFPVGTYWHERTSQDEIIWWTCPCMLGDCIRLCMRDVAEIAHLPMAPLPIHVPVWEGDVKKTVSVTSYFKVVHEAACTIEGFFWDDGLTTSDFRIQKDGSIYSPNKNDPFTSKYTNAKSYCLMPHDNKRHLNVLLCDPVIDWEVIVFPLFFVVSAVFLLLTVLAYVFTQNHYSVFDRSVVCFSCTLLLAYIGLTVKVLSAEASYITACKTMAYVQYTFELASFFWLNVMCIDLFIITKKAEMCTVDIFYKLAAYVSGTSFVLFLIMLVVDITTSHPTLSPGIGVESCWFRSFWGSFIYMNGPILLLLVINTVLLIIIEVRFRRQKISSLRRKQQDKESSTLIIKLLLLMGFTWLFEIMSWADGSKFAIWHVTDSVSAIRGVFVFWICVYSNDAVWEPLRMRFWPRKEIPEEANDVAMTTIETSASHSDIHM